MTVDELILFSKANRDAGFYKGLLEGILMQMHEALTGDLYTIDVEVIEKVKKLIEQ